MFRAKISYDVSILSEVAHHTHHVAGKQSTVSNVFSDDSSFIKFIHVAVTNSVHANISVVSYTWSNHSPVMLAIHLTKWQALVTAAYFITEGEET